VERHRVEEVDDLDSMPVGDESPSQFSSRAVVPSPH
jgi:hypothetical protein